MVRSDLAHRFKQLTVMGDGVKRALIVDLCGTLILDNTTQAFLRVLAHTPWLRVRNRLLVGRLGAYANRIAGEDLARKLLIGSLKGRSSNEVELRAKAYVRNALSARGSDFVIRVIKAAQSDRVDVYLATASIEPIAIAVVNELNLTGYVSTQLEKNADGTLTGRIASDTTGKKWKELTSKHPDLDGAEISVYTDNVEDTDLRAVAEKFVFLG